MEQAKLFEPAEALDLHTWIVWYVRRCTRPVTRSQLVAKRYSVPAGAGWTVAERAVIASAVAVLVERGELAWCQPNEPAREPAVRVCAPRESGPERPSAPISRPQSPPPVRGPVRRQQRAPVGA